MENKRNEWIGGLFLIGLGVLFLLNQFFDLPIIENLAVFIVLGLGLIFLAWGVLSHEVGFMIPGGILTGIGLGIVLIAGPFDMAGGRDSGGLFMGAFALGWVLITVFSGLFSDETQWWALIPAAIMALVSGALLIEGPFMVALEWVGKLWPLALIIAGIAVLAGARKVTSKGADSASESELPESKLKTE
jgi:hypothetical protein